MSPTSCQTALSRDITVLSELYYNNTDGALCQVRKADFCELARESCDSLRQHSPQAASAGAQYRCSSASVRPEKSVQNRKERLPLQNEYSAQPQPAVSTAISHAD